MLGAAKGIVSENGLVQFTTLVQYLEGFRVSSVGQTQKLGGRAKPPMEQTQNVRRAVGDIPFSTNGTVTFLFWKNYQV